MCFLLKIEITLLLRNINEKHIFIQTAPYRLYRIPCTYCSSVHKNRYDHQKHQKPTSLKIADEKGNSKKNQLKMKREFLNTLYSSSYTGAGALCSTSVDLVFSEMRTINITCHIKRSKVNTVHIQLSHLHFPLSCAWYPLSLTSSYCWSIWPGVPHQVPPPIKRKHGKRISIDHTCPNLKP